MSASAACEAAQSAPAPLSVADLASAPRSSRSRTAWIFPVADAATMSAVRLDFARELTFAPCAKQADLLWFPCGPH